MAIARVLIVDDDPEFLDELSETLSDSGFDTRGVSDSTQAIEEAKKVKPDVILLDLKMPGKSGFQVADELRRLPETSTIPVVAITGFYTEKDEMSLMHIFGIRKCLTKPVAPDEVIAQIESLLKK